MTEKRKEINSNFFSILKTQAPEFHAAVLFVRFRKGELQCRWLGFNSLSFVKQYRKCVYAKSNNDIENQPSELQLWHA